MSTENVSNEEKGNGILADVMAKLPDEEMIKKMSQQYMVSNRTIGGGDAGWIQAAYKDGMRDLVKMLKGS